MPVKCGNPKTRILSFPDWQVTFMGTGTLPKELSDEICEWTVSEWRCHLAQRNDPVKAAWDKIGDIIIAEWIKRRPGTRPYCWWVFSAPEPRRRIGGRGTPGHEKLPFRPSYKFGVPDNWVGDIYVRWYSHKNIEIPYPLEPPTFESQAAYLDRHGLLTDDELEVLPADAFEPVAYVLCSDL